MGYDVEITRDPHSSLKAERQIRLEEWYDLVRRDGDLRLVASGDPERHPPLTVLWTAHPDADSEAASRWLHFGVGRITVKYPDEHMLKKMLELARPLNAMVVGDNGEVYAFDGEGKVVADDRGAPTPVGPFVYGIGAMACRDVVAMWERDGPVAMMLGHSWYLGFLTSFNQARHAGGNAVVNYTITPERVTEDQAFLRAYSVEHPDKHFVLAALALIRMHSMRLGA